MVAVVLSRRFVCGLLFVFGSWSRYVFSLCDPHFLQKMKSLSFVAKQRRHNTFASDLSTTGFSPPYGCEGFIFFPACVDES